MVEIIRYTYYLFDCIDVFSYKDIYCFSRVCLSDDPYIFSLYAQTCTLDEASFSNLNSTQIRVLKKYGGRCTDENYSKKPYLIQDLSNTPGQANSRVKFIGWDRNNQRYALEIYRVGDGAWECDFGSYELQIVNAKTDSWVKGARVKVSNKESQTGDCLYTEEQLSQRFESKRDTSLRRFGIVTGYYSKPLPIRPSGKDYSFPYQNQKALLSFSVRKQNFYNAGYYLSWKSPIDKKIENGKVRENIMDYQLHSVFLSPDGSHIAFLIRRLERVFEGEEWSFMSNGSSTK